MLLKDFSTLLNNVYGCVFTNLDFSVTLAGLFTSSHIFEKEWPNNATNRDSTHETRAFLHA
jgi:hypothetical protein